MATYEQGLDALEKELRVAKAKGDKVALAKLKRKYEMMKEAKQGPSFAGGLVRSALGQGLAMGFGDELEAFARSKLNGTSYEEELMHARGQQEKWAAENPVADIGGQVVAGMIPGVGIAKGVGLAAKGASRLAQLAGAGAVEGGLFGAGSAEEGGRLAGAATGVALGAGLGAAGRGLEKGLQSRTHRLASNKLAQRLRDVGYEGTPQEIADAARRAVQEMGPETVLADTDAALRQLYGAAYRATPRKEATKRALEARQRGASDRVVGEVERITATRETPSQALERMGQTRRQTAEANYGRVEGQPVRESMNMWDALQYPEGEKAAQRALRKYRLENRNPDLTLDEAKQSVDFWHQWQQEMADEADVLQRQGYSRYGGQVGGLRRDVMEDIFQQPGATGTMGPDYRTAQTAYREQSQIMDLVEEGDQFFKMTPEEFSQTLSGLSPEGRQAVTIGAIGKIRNMLDMGPESANHARNLMKSAALRQKFEQLLGPDDAEELMRRLQNDVERYQTEQALLHGSQTAERLGADVTEAERGLGTVLGAVANWDFPGAIKAGVRTILPRIGGMNPGTADELLRVLGESDPARLQQMIEAALRGTPWNPNVVPALMGGAGAALAPSPGPGPAWDPYKMTVDVPY